jgi:predicted HAD superfamily Cof-like phosphohydrolase
MKEVEALNGVAKFHEVFKHPIKKNPDIPDKKRCDLRIELLQEELNELQQAIIDRDLVEVADALCDIQYVLSGAVLEFGFGNKFAELFAEVQRSNMSKACASKGEAELTIKHYVNQGIEAYIVASDGKFLIYRKSDNKTLKSVNYSPADLGKIVSI